MAQEQVFQLLAIVLSHKLRSRLVVEVPGFLADALFKVFGIRALVEHTAVVVAFEHQIVGFLGIEGSAGIDYAHIGSHHKLLTVVFNHKAHVVRTVVRGIECRDCEIGNLKRNFLEHVFLILLDSARHAMAAQKAVHQSRSAI